MTNRRHPERSFGFRPRSGTVAAAAIVLRSVLVALGAASVPGEARAACNLIPSDPDRFQSVIGATNRPFAGPGDVVEVALATDGCDASSLGTSGASAADLVATYVFKPAAGEAAHVAVVASDCEARHEALDACRTEPSVASVTCLAAAGERGIPRIELFEREATAIVGLRFPDTDALVGASDDGRGFAGPVAIAVTRAEDMLPCTLAASSCSQLPAEARLVACVDEMHASGPTCALARDTLHRDFPGFLALPRMNAAEPSQATPMLAARDGAGALVIPIDWRRPQLARTQSSRPPMQAGRRALDALGARLGAARALTSADVAVFTAWGRALPPLADAAVETAARSLFEDLSVPLTVLRIATRTCTGGASMGRPCREDSQCPEATCAAPLFDASPVASDAAGVYVLAPAPVAAAADAGAPPAGAGALVVPVEAVVAASAR